MPLAGRPMVEWSIAAFRACESVGEIVVACPPGHAHGLSGEDLSAIEGGEVRSASVSNALDVVKTELVAVHDAARPLVTPELIDELAAQLDAAPEAAGVIAATPVTDTVKRANSIGAKPSDAFPGHRPGNTSFVVEETLDRGELWAAQTPQVFRAGALRAAFAADPEGRAGATDESSLIEAAGGTVLIHPSSPENLKVTTPLDLKLAEQLLAPR